MSGKFKVDEVLTADEFAKAFRISRRTLERRLKSDWMPAGWERVQPAGPGTRVTFRRVATTEVAR